MGGLWHHQDDTSNAPRHNDGDDRARSCARVVAFVGLDAVRGVTRYLCVASRREAVADDGLGIGVIVTSGIGEGEDLQGVGWGGWGGWRWVGHAGGEAWCVATMVVGVGGGQYPVLDFEVKRLTGRAEQHHARVLAAGSV